MNLATAMSIVGAANRADPFPTNSKMPGPSWGLPTHACNRGTTLSLDRRSMCHPSNCYAKRGFYRTEHVKRAQDQRLVALRDREWVDAFVFILETRYRDQGYFRWHDSGDFQGRWHLDKVMEVARRCPWMKFWAPTHEAGLLAGLDPAEVPLNLTIRLSADHIGGVVPTGWANTSTVHQEYGDPPAGSAECRAHDRDNACRGCRNCWKRKIGNISYPRTTASGVRGVRSNQLRIFQ